MSAFESNQPTRLRQLLLALVVCLAFPGVGNASDDGGVTNQAPNAADPGSPASPGASGPTGTLVDRAVAIVNDRVVTERQLEFETRVLLVKGGGVEAAFRPLPPSAMRAGLEMVIGQLLEQDEADKLKAYEFDDSELDTAVREFERDLGGPANLNHFLEIHEADRATLAAVLYRSLRTDRALEGKLKLKATVSDLEAKRWLAAHPEDRDIPLPALKSKLFNERFAALVDNELRQVRRSRDVKVRLLGPYAEPIDAGVR